MPFSKLIPSALVACGLLLSGPAFAVASDASTLCGGGKKGQDDKDKDRKNPQPACGDMKKPKDDDDKKKKNPA
ncbi:MAG: hypothetical protein KF718_28135 [Polyangiaceae bacterium]|nr:hypothetical protein [Polyangiaceae bacterium]